CDEILERHPAPLVRDTLACGTHDQQRFQIRQPPEREPGDQRDRGAEHTDESRLEGHLDGAPWCRRYSEETVWQIEAFIYPDEQRDEDETERFEEQGFVDRTRPLGHMEPVPVIGRIAAVRSYLLQSTVCFGLPRPA